MELADGRFLAFGRFAAEEPAQKLFELTMPMSTSGDLRTTWQWPTSGSPVVSSTQRPAMPRLAEGPLLLCSFTDQARTPLQERQGLSFRSTGGDHTGTGLYAAVGTTREKPGPTAGSSPPTAGPRPTSRATSPWPRAGMAAST